MAPVAAREGAGSCCQQPCWRWQQLVPQGPEKRDGCWSAVATSKGSNFYPGNEDGGQAHGTEEALARETATTQEQPPFTAARLWTFLAHSGERDCSCLVKVEVLVSTLPQGGPTTIPGLHCSCPHPSSGAFPTNFIRLCGPGKSQSQNRLESWL